MAADASRSGARQSQAALHSWGRAERRLVLRVVRKEAEFWGYCTWHRNSKVEGERPLNAGSLVVVARGAVIHHPMDAFCSLNVALPEIEC